MRLIEALNTEELMSLINGRVSALINKNLNRRFRAAGLNITTEQWSVLTFLWEKDKQTQQSIADATYKEKASVTRLVDSLEKNGLVCRQADPADRRTNIVTLTRRGEEIESIANSIVEDIFSLSTELVSIDDLKYMVSTFRKIIKKLETED